MITSSDLRPGTAFRMEGVIFEVVTFQRVKPGKGGAFVRTKIRNIKQGTVIDKTFSSSSEKIDDIRLEEKRLQYSYKAGEMFNFMDMETYDQFEFTAEQIGDGIKFLKEEMIISMLMHESEILGVRLPLKVDLKVTEAPPNIKGDTAGSVNKPITLETGTVVQAPIFVVEGDIVKIDTRTGEYLERVRK